MREREREREREKRGRSVGFCSFPSIILVLTRVLFPSASKQQWRGWVLQGLRTGVVVISLFLCLSLSFSLSLSFLCVSRFPPVCLHLSLSFGCHCWLKKTHKKKLSKTSVHTGLAATKNISMKTSCYVWNNKIWITPKIAVSLNTDFHSDTSSRWQRLDIFIGLILLLSQ